MRYIKIPSPITCIDPVTKKPLVSLQDNDDKTNATVVTTTLSFAEFMLQAVVAGITGSREKWNQANELEQLILNAKDDLLILTETQWGVLSAACDKPLMSGAAARQFAPFLNCVCGADTVKPVALIAEGPAEAKADDSRNYEAAQQS